MWDKHSCLSFFANIGQARMPIPPINVLLRQPPINVLLRQPHYRYSINISEVSIIKGGITP
jgi:hypothetical protein